MGFRNKLWTGLLLLLLSACYTFKASSIDPALETFTVSAFDEQAANARPGLGITLSEALRDRILRETRLNSTSENGDIIFEGEIIDYSITPISPKSGETTSREQLSVSVNVRYTDRKNPARSWEQVFKAQENYDTNENFSSVENQLLESIRTQIVDAIFRKAFENW